MSERDVFVERKKDIQIGSVVAAAALTTAERCEMIVVMCGEDRRVCVHCAYDKRRMKSAHNNTSTSTNE